MKGFPLQEREAAEVARDNFETEASRLSDHLQHDHPAEPIGHLANTAVWQAGYDAGSRDLEERRIENDRLRAVLREIASMEPGSRGAYQKFERAALIAKRAIGK